MACFGNQVVQESKGFGGQASSSKRKSSKKRKPGTSNHRREQCPLGRDPGLQAIQARQCLGLPLTGRLSVSQVKRAHKTLAVQHHPDKGGDPALMTRFNTARDVLLQPEMDLIAA